MDETKQRYMARVKNTTLDLLMPRLQFFLVWLECEIDRIDDGLCILDYRNREGEEVIAVVLAQYVSDAIDLEIQLAGGASAQGAGAMDLLGRLLKRYYDVELTPVADSTGEPEVLAAVKRGRKRDGSTVWLEYMINMKGCRPGSKPEGNDLYEMWLELARFEKPDDQELDDPSKAWDRFRKAAERARVGVSGKNGKND